MSDLVISTRPTPTPSTEASGPGTTAPTTGPGERGPVRDGRGKDETNPGGRVPRNALPNDTLDPVPERPVVPQEQQPQLPRIQAPSGGGVSLRGGR